MHDDLIERLRAYAPTILRHGLVKPHSRASLSKMLTDAADALEAAGRDARRWRIVMTKGKLPVRCSGGYYYDDGILHPTAESAIDAIAGRGEDGE